jgi:cell division protein ZapA
MKRSYAVQIAGQDLSIRSDEGPKYVQSLATFVDDQVRQFADGRRTIPLQRVALLVAMQLADELFRERDLHQRLRKKVEARLQDLEQALADHRVVLESMPVDSTLDGADEEASDHQTP